MSDYAKKLMDGISLFGWQMDFAVFHGMPSSMPIADDLSSCCYGDLYSENQWAAGPTCSVCHRPCGIKTFWRVKGKRVVFPIPGQP